MQVWVRVWDPVGHKYLPYYWQEEKKQLWYVSPYHWWYVSPYHWLYVSPYHWWYVSPYHWRPDILHHPPPWAVNWHPHVGMTGWQPLVWKWPGVPCGPYVGPGWLLVPAVPFGPMRGSMRYQGPVCAGKSTLLSPETVAVNCRPGRPGRMAPTWPKPTAGPVCIVLVRGGPDLTVWPPSLHQREMRAL